MSFPFFRREKSPKQKMTSFLKKFNDKARAFFSRVRNLPKPGYYAEWLKIKLGKARRSASYVASDARHRGRKLGRHIEAALFSAIIFLGAAMLILGAGESFLNSLMALILLVLIVVIYMQMRFQKRLLDQYVPSMDLIRIAKCQLFSDRVRMLNLYGAAEKLNEIKHVSNVRIGYSVTNDSFAPVAVHSASLAIKVRGKERVLLPTAMSMLDVEPKKTGASTVIFRLKNPVGFDSIEWVELELRGNCTKRVRIRPHLYVNIMLRDEKSQMIFERFSDFMGRKEFAKEEAAGAGQDAHKKSL